MPRTYVDNAYNRSAGRVGLPMGSAVISRGSSGGSSFSGSSNPSSYAGTSGISFSGSSSSRTYVDNSFNRSAGRVGLPMGSAVISRGSSGGSSSTGASSNRTYVDNSFNRSAGRVGLPIGSAVISLASNISDSPQSSLVSGGKLYVDNAMNRRLGRVGLPVGSLVSRGSSSVGQKTYIDNDMNRKLGRVGLPLGSSPVKASFRQNPKSHDLYSSNDSDFESKPKLLRDVFQHLVRNPDEDFDYPSNYDNISEQDQLAAVDQVLDYFRRAMEIKQWCKESNCQDEPKTSRELLEDFSGPIIPFKDLELRSIIGRGAFGDVHMAKYQGTVIAVKKLRVQRVAKKRLQAFTDEISVFCTLKHKNIVRFIGACVVTPNLCICMEFMKTSLHSALHMETIPFTEKEKLEIMVQIGDGLAYLHDRQVAHCDVKSANVLLDYEPKIELTVKLTDFGLSMMKNDAESSTSSMNVHGNRGTPRYSAPEVLRGERLSHSSWKQADVYSTALVFYEVACEVEPFEGLSLLQLTKQVGEKSLMPTIPKEAQLDSYFEEQLKKCWRRQEDRRPSAHALVAAIRHTDKVLRQ